MIATLLRRRPTARQRYAAAIVQIHDDMRDAEHTRANTTRHLAAEVEQLRRMLAAVPAWLEGRAEAHRLDAGHSILASQRSHDQQVHLAVAHHLLDAARDFTHYAELADGNN
jgi:hypothetical protein